MKEPSITVVPPPQPANQKSSGISPELAFLLSGIDDEAQRNSVIGAFYNFAGGQPDGFGAQFAVLLQAFTLAVRLTPEHVKKAFGNESKALQTLLIAYQTSLKESTIAVTKQAALSADQVESLKKEIRQSQQAERKARGEETAQFNRQLEELHRDLPDVYKAAAMLNDVKERLFWWTVGLSIASGAGLVILVQHLLGR
jgi:hypothetical protein